MPADLTDSRDGVRRREVGAAARIEQSIAAAGSSACARAFLATDFAGARAAAAAADRAVAAGRDPGPLAGLAVSIKDLFDVEGEPTRAASIALADAAPAAHDAPAVARLRRAGAAFIGRTNMSEFAFSGVGINPHHGTPANPATARARPDTAHSRAARPPAAPFRSPPARPGRRSAPTPAARSASRRRCKASSASRPRRGGCRSTAPCRSRRRWTRSRR